VTREHVLQALTEYDSLGDEGFLTKYGFGRARSYVLWHEGHSYDSKAIFGVAYGVATGTPLRPSEFSGGKAAAAKWLRAMGFEVADPPKRRAQA
jgi:hypothetical protein